MGELRTGATMLVLASASLAFAQNPPTFVAVDAQADRHPISPNIYGLAFAATSDLVALNCPLNRSGATPKPATTGC
jgi:hypothetical protein